MGKQTLQPGDVVEISSSGHPFFGQTYTIESFLGSKYVQCKNNVGATFTFRISEVHAMEAESKKKKKPLAKDSKPVEAVTSENRPTARGTFALLQHAQESLPSKKSSKKGTSNAKTHASRKKETSKGTKKTASKKKNARKKKWS